MTRWRILHHPHIRVTSIYMLVATLWILFSDTLLLRLGLGNTRTSYINILKGLGFVLVTSGILLAYLRREFRLRFQLEAKLREQVRQAKQAQQALEASQQRFRKAVEEAPMPIVIHAEDGQIITLSNTWSEITGYAKDQIATIADWTEKAYGERQATVREGIDRLFKLDHRVDEGTFVVRCADGRERIWTFSSTPLGKLPDGRRIVMSSAADVTNLVQTQQDLHIKDSAIAATITPIALADLDGKLTYVNQAFADLWKLDGPEAAIGRSVLAFWATPATAQVVVDALAQQESFQGELVAKLADGTTADIELTATMVRDEDGKPLCMMGSFNDITRQKQAEMVALENERLRGRFQKEQERNALVQRIISALSHDLRTPLAVIQSSKDILASYRDQITEERRLEKLDTIGRQVQFALELLEDTVNMARGNLDTIPFQPEPVNVAALCQVSLDEIQSTDVKHHHLRFVNRSNTTIATLDEVLVSRILLNLLSNAIKYSPEDTEIILELDQREDWLVLRVYDRGVGIDADDLQQVFEPFFRANNVGGIKGTGLGLSIVKDCVVRHQGRVFVESTPGEGSIFTVELPFEKQGQAIMTH